MHRRLKIGGLVVGAGVLVGLGAIGGMKLQTPDEPVAISNGGSVVLDSSTTPTPTPDPLALRVAAANPTSVQSQTTTNSNAESTPAPAAGPGPADFKQYEKYHDEKNALFGDLAAGQGKAVAAGSVVTVAYRGWLTDGSLFDDSYSTGKAFAFTEGEHRVISGWEQGLFGMKAGGKRRLIVPPSAGYGAEAHGPIPAGSVLVFDVELIEVK